MAGHRLVALAALRSSTVTVDGEVFEVHQPSWLDEMEYGQRMNAERDKPPRQRIQALAYLLSACVTQDGKPVFTEEEARVIAGGKTEIIGPLVAGIFALKESDPDREERQKKGSAMSNGSGTDSPSPSAEPSERSKARSAAKNSKTGSPTAG